MKNVNVLLAVVLCAGLCVLFRLFNRSADESLGWSPNEMYMQSISSGEGASFTSANLSSGNMSNDGIAVSMRNGSFSLRTRASRASSLTPNNPIASSPNNLPSLQGGAGGRLSSSGSLIGHMTSSAEYHSFGGGSNMAMGSYTSSSNSLIASSPTIGSYRPSPSSPIALSPNASGVGFNNLPSLQGGAWGRPIVSAEQALISASSSASGLFGSALQNTYGTASYDQTIYGSYGSTPRGVRGRQNAMPGLDDGWWQWLDQWIKGNGSKYGQGTLGEDGYYSDGYHLDRNEMTEAYNDFINNYWNEGMGDPPSFEDWWDWYSSAMYANGGEYNYNGHRYFWTPVGDILPLVLMAMLYMIILFVKRNKTVQL